MNQRPDGEFIEAMVDIANGLDMAATLKRILQSAVSVSGARYGAIAILNQNRELQDFVTWGLTDHQIDEIERSPCGVGLLGELASQPEPLRLADMSKHPASVGFPKGHPPMKSFLGVPLSWRDEVVGNLYLTDKPGGFTKIDEDQMIGLGAASGVAVHNARLFDALGEREQWQAAASEISVHALSGDDAGEILQTAVKTCVSLTGADAGVVAMGKDLDFDVEVVWKAGGADDDSEHEADVSPSALIVGLGEALPMTHPILRGSAEGAVVNTGEIALESAAGWLCFGSAMILPLRTADAMQGLLILLCREAPTEQVVSEPLGRFVDQVATVLALDAERRSAESLEVYRERDRIARDLHDVVVQRLFAAGMSLQVACGAANVPKAGKDRVQDVVSELDGVISEIRNTIFGLRESTPPLGQVVREEILRLESALGVLPDLDLGPDAAALTDPIIVTHTSAAIREALSNAAKHSGANDISISLIVGLGKLSVSVEDNGAGVDTSGGRRSGLANLAARCQELGGSFSLEFRGPSRGTILKWQIPL